MTEKIEKEIEVKAKQITSNLIAFMKELDTEANKQIKELDLDIEFYKKENAELKERIQTLEQIKKEHTDYTIKVEEERTSVKEQLTKAKDHIKKLLGCLQQDTNNPQTNYYVVKYMTEAEQFLNSEVEK